MDKIKLTINGEEKEYSPEELAEVISSAVEANTQLATMSGFKKVLDRYEIDPETYLQQAEGSIAVLARLIDDGIVDEKGVPTKAEERKREAKKDVTADLLKEKRGNPTDDKTSEFIAKTLQGLEGKISAQQATINRLLQNDLEMRLQKQFPSLDAEDVDRVLDMAYRDANKPLKEHAKEYAEKKDKRMLELRQSHAKEFGIDLEALELSKKAKEERETSGDKFGTKQLIGEKKISSRDARKGDKDAVTPRQLTEQFIEKAQAEGLT